MWDGRDREKLLTKNYLLATSDAANMRIKISKKASIQIKWNILHYTSNINVYLNCIIFKN